MDLARIETLIRAKLLDVDATTQKNRLAIYQAALRVALKHDDASNNDLVNKVSQVIDGIEQEFAVVDASPTTEQDAAPILSNPLPFLEAADFALDPGFEKLSPEGAQTDQKHTQKSGQQPEHNFATDHGNEAEFGFDHAVSEPDHTKRLPPEHGASRNHLNFSGVFNFRLKPLTPKAIGSFIVLVLAILALGVWIFSAPNEPANQPSQSTQKTNKQDAPPQENNLLVYKADFRNDSDKLDPALIKRFAKTMTFNRETGTLTVSGKAKIASADLFPVAPGRLYLMSFEVLIGKSKQMTKPGAKGTKKEKEVQFPKIFAGFELYDGNADKKDAGDLKASAIRNFVVNGDISSLEIDDIGDWQYVSGILTGTGKNINQFKESTRFFRPALSFDQVNAESGPVSIRKIRVYAID